ncbi:hypothetical protein Ancab_001550 [Ancistrocladus abbreviatus]
MKKENHSAKRGPSRIPMEFNDQDWDIRKIRKEIEHLGSSYMTWKERKDLENQKIVSLGGKPPKKQRLPLSVARVVMKKQKERKQKMLKENPLLERLGGSARRPVERRKPEEMALKASEGHFRNGVLDVKRLLQPAPSRDSDNGTPVSNKWKKKKGSKKNCGKKKGKGRKRH